MSASWNATTETLFSAWIEKLFDAPPDQDLNWKVWQEVLRDQSRNFLFNYLGAEEDTPKNGLRPDRVSGSGVPLSEPTPARRGSAFACPLP